MVTYNIKKVFGKINKLFREGFFHILTGNVLVKAISMISAILVARIIDKSEYAYLTYADNLYTYIASVSGMGLSSALLLVCGIKKKKENNASYLRFSLRIGCTFDLCMSFFLSVITWVVDIPYKEAKHYIVILIIYPFFSCFSTTLLSFLRTQGKNREYASAGVLQAVILCGVGVLLSLLFGANGLIIARYISVFCVLIFLLHHCWDTFSYRNGCDLGSAEKKGFIRSGITMLIANFFSGIMPTNEMFLVNHIIRDETETANFRVASQFPPLLLLISGAIMIYYFPIVAQMNDWKLIRKTVYKIGILCFVSLSILAFLGAMMTPLAIRILYGDKYIDAISITYILWLMRAMNACIRITPLNMFPAIGRAKINMYMSIGSCLLQTIADYYFIKIMGVQGVAIGAIVVYALSGVVYWLMFEHICREEIRLETKEDD